MVRLPGLSPVHTQSIEVDPAVQDSFGQPWPFPSFFQSNVLVVVASAVLANVSRSTPAASSAPMRLIFMVPNLSLVIPGL